ncbi:MAG TPA: PKD domain-containing protein [Solirubrobacteraceae bacterium]|jgi:hypothetical protein|nr:PKD domain-containing protein [Solirubrobacteraceae bacterium]
MKWSAYGEDDHLALEFTPNFNEYPGGFLIDPDAAGTERFGVGIGEGSSRNTVYFARPSAGVWHYYAFVIDSKSYSTDGGGSATISHTFSAPGTYTIDLRVKDSLGETATVSHTVTVGAELGRYEQAVEDTAGVTHFWPMSKASGSSFADAVGGANAEVLGRCDTRRAGRPRRGLLGSGGV